MNTVIVTGASRGIGAAICRNLRTKGVRVVGVARTANALAALSAEKIGPSPMEYVVGDVTDASVAQAAVKLATEGGSLMALILNAAVLGPIAPIAETKSREFLDAINVNVAANVEWIRSALPALRKSKGRIIVTSSGASTIPFPGFAAYCVSKAAINTFIGVLAVEEPEIVALSVEPGVVDTEMSLQFLEQGKGLLPAQQVAFLENLRKGGQLLKPETVAEAFVQLTLKAPQTQSGKYVNWNEPWIQQL